MLPPHWLLQFHDQQLYSMNHSDQEEEDLFHLNDAMSPCHAVSYEIEGITYSTKIRGKIFAIEWKIMKTTKVFPLESFAVYGMSVIKLL